MEQGVAKPAGPEQICQHCSPSLGEETKIWSRIVDGLLKGQLPFLLKAGSDTLPTPMNLYR